MTELSNSIQVVIDEHRDETTPALLMALVKTQARLIAAEADAAEREELMVELVDHLHVEVANALALIEL